MFGPIFGSGKELYEAPDHKWFMDEYEQNSKLEKDHHGWNLEDDLFTSENGYKSLFTTRGLVGNLNIAEDHSDDHLSKRRRKLCCE